MTHWSIFSADCFCSFSQTGSLLRSTTLVLTWTDCCLREKSPKMAEVKQRWLLHLHCLSLHKMKPKYPDLSAVMLLMELLYWVPVQTWAGSAMNNGVSERCLRTTNTSTPSWEELRKMIETIFGKITCQHAGRGSIWALLRQPSSMLSVLMTACAEEAWVQLDWSQVV